MSALEVERLSVTYGGGQRAVTDVSFEVADGESLAIVGESGSGKSTLARAFGGLLPPSSVTGFDRLVIAGRELRPATGDGRGSHAPIGVGEVLGADLSYVFQEPKQHLNPSLKIGSQLREVLRLHGGVDAAGSKAQAGELLDEVGLNDPGRILASYPHQVSGGQAQRVAIAMAVATRPRLLVLDEPTSALDVTVAARIVALVRRLQREHEMAVVHITHNLHLAARSCDRVAVMYAGEMVELGAAHDVLTSPLMPYTEALLEAVPALQDDGGYIAPTPIEGAPPDLRTLDAGCRFRARCRYAADVCHLPLTLAPTHLAGETERLVRCARLGELPTTTGVA